MLDFENNVSLKLREPRYYNTIPPGGIWRAVSLGSLFVSGIAHTACRTLTLALLLATGGPAAVVGYVQGDPPGLGVLPTRHWNGHFAPSARACQAVG
jgi:hypothetical protein